MKYKFFGYCPDGGFETFETKKEAIEYAQESIDHFRDEACEGWSEEVSGVCWGEIKQETVKFDEKTNEEAAKDGIFISDASDGYCDYKLV